MRKRNSELTELPLFSDASRSELATINQKLTRLTLPAGTVLVHEGEPGREFMVLVDGEAEVSQGGDVIAKVGRGDVVGEMALLAESGQGLRNASVTALTKVEVYVGNRAEFRQLVTAVSSFAKKVRSTANARTLVAA
jgi:CRP-like cAMP-binding protein